MSNNFISRTRDFLDKGLWNNDDSHLGRLTRYARQILKIVVMTVREFLEQKATVRASALTYYTLLSVIPTLALAFAIAKGFNLESLLTSYISDNLTSPEVAAYIISFASSALENTRSGIIAGVGVIMLLYSVFKLLANIEEAFNLMWCVRSPRTMLRKVTDYIAIMIFTPILLLTALSANILFRSSLREHLSGSLSPLQDFLVALSPYVMIWIFFTLLYLILPNAKVKPLPAIIAGVITGTAFQIVQWVYITFQVGVNSAGAIYGSFAFLPLLLAWLQLTWTIVLAGCKIAFSIQNVNSYALERGVRLVSINLQQTLALVIMYHTVADFEQQRRSTAISMANDLQIPQPIFFFLTDQLIRAGLLAELKTDANNQDRAFIPALNPTQITPALITSRLNALGDDDRIHVNRSPLFLAMQQNANSPSPISSIPIPQPSPN